MTGEIQKFNHLQYCQSADFRLPPNKEFLHRYNPSRVTVKVEIREHQPQIISIRSARAQHERQLPFKKRLLHLNAADFIEKQEVDVKSTEAETNKNVQKTRNRSARFQPGPYEKPVTRHQAKRALDAHAIESTKQAEPPSKKSRNSKTGKENEMEHFTDGNGIRNNGSNEAKQKKSSPKPKRNNRRKSSKGDDIALPPTDVVDDIGSNNTSPAIKTSEHSLIVNEQQTENGVQSITFQQIEQTLIRTYHNFMNYALQSQTI